jgi:uncharacterized protein (TIGR03437 family)
VNAAHFLPQVPVSPGSLISIFGVNLAASSEGAKNVPLPMTLADRFVEIDDEIRAPLLFISPGQANLQLPMDAPVGSRRIAVRREDTGELLAGSSIAIADAGPGFFSGSQDGAGQVAALNEDNTRNGPSNPARRGSVVQLFGTGQGPVAPSVASGLAAPSSPLSKTVASPTADGNTCLTSQPSLCVAVGSTFGEVSFSGLAPGFVGLWQINVRIPDNALTGGAVPVKAVINGRPSNSLTLAIQ